MSRHPSRSVLRRMIDEPAGAGDAERTHIASCAACTRRSAAMAAAADVAGRALGDASVGAVATEDALPALRRLRAGEAHVVAPKPTVVDRFRSRLELAPRRALRIGAVLAVVAATMGTLVATGVANDVIQIFQPETIVALPVDITSLGSLPDLSGYGTVSILKTPDVSSPASLADAAADSGLHLLTPGKLPASVHAGDTSFHVIGAGSASFTFNANVASGTATKLGKPLPSLPARLDGAVLRLDGGPLVVEAIGSQSMPLLRGSDAASPGAEPAHGSLFGDLGTLPQVLIVQMKAPTLFSSGPTVAEYEDALLSMPGMPASLAAQIRALGNPSSTLPIPIPTSLASSHTADINGAPGLVVGDTTGIASAVIWQSHGLLFGVAGSLTDHQVVDIARSMH